MVLDSGMMVTIEDSMRGMMSLDGSANPLVGLKAEKLPASYVGKLLNVSVEYALGIWVDRLAVFGAHIGGFQRELDPQHARRIARAMAEGVPMPPVIMAVIPGDRSKVVRVVDGQHRLVACVLARVPVMGVILEMSLVEQMAMFSSQGHSTRVAKGHLTLSGTNAIQEYIQDAVTSEEHAWSGLISTSPVGTRTTIGPSTAEHIISCYTLGILATSNLKTGIDLDKQIDEKFKPEYGSELLSLLLVWGPKTAGSHWPWRTVYLRAVTSLATLAIRRKGSPSELMEMWEKIMPHFPWEQNAAFTHSASAWLQELVAYWNDRTANDPSAHVRHQVR